MGSFFDQRFYLRFCLFAFVDSSTPFTSRTPAKVVMGTMSGEYLGYYRCVYIPHASKNSYGTYKTRLPLDPFYLDVKRTPDVQNQSIEFLASVSGSRPSPVRYECSFTLEFDDLTLPLTSSVVDKLNDPTFPSFYEVIPVGDGMVKMTNFNNFVSRRLVSRRSYNTAHSSYTEHKTYLVTTSQSEEVPIEMELHVSQQPHTGTNPYLRLTYYTTLENLTLDKLIEVPSTGETETGWTGRTWTFTPEQSGYPTGYPAHPGTER